MQDAYVVDQAKKGDWTAIGYEKPTSKNLDYTETNDWTATPTSSWGPTCTVSTTWNVGVTVTSGKAAYQASDNCPNLTPNFKNIGTSS